MGMGNVIKAEENSVNTLLKNVKNGKYIRVGRR